MDVFDALGLIGGLCLFLFGMNLMGQALERRAGSRLSCLLGKMTSNKFAGFFTGLAVTAIIQSSSATTVMVVGFVNSGIMTLRQAINVIMGANVGTTVTAWILSLGGIESGSVFVKLLKPTSFTPVLALIGIIFYMFCRSSKKKDTGIILLGFATLMYGMDAMSGSVSGLSDIPAFRELFIMFENPLLGMLVGALLTAVIQSSSASVGILQALSSTGQVSYGAAVPIIMGQNIGTCITAIISSFGANKNAKRAAVVHLSFNVIGSMVWLTVFVLLKAIFAPIILDRAASEFGIAICHSLFNILCTALMFPMTGILEKLSSKIVRDAKTPETVTLLDERLLSTPPVALERSSLLTVTMGETATDGLKKSLEALANYTPELAKAVRDAENDTDRYEDVLGTYLVRLSSYQMSDKDSADAAKLLRVIGDFERISDHSVNIVESAEEMNEKGISLSEHARAEISVLSQAVSEILTLSLTAFRNSDMASAAKVEPLEQVVDGLKETLRSRHIARLQQGECTISAGFVLSDLLTNLERVADHCSNIAGCVIDTAKNNMNLHESLRAVRAGDEEFRRLAQLYSEKYSISELRV